MRENRLRNAVLAALAPVGTALIVTSAASAQPTATLTNTYDNSSSFLKVGDAGYSPYNPVPLASDNANFAATNQDYRFEYGGSYPASTASILWTGAQDDTAATAGSGGSVKLSWTFKDTSSGGSSKAAFTTDLFPFATGTQPGALVTDISFNMMVGLGSAEDKYGGNGYFQVFARNESYGGFTSVYAEELANPSYGGPSTSLAGTWETVNISFGTPVPVRAITFQDYNGGSTTGRDINGPETLYIDNLNVTYEVPEPASLGLLGVGVPALLMRRRSKVKGS